MKLFKFLFYCSAFFIGLTLAFCANTDYEKNAYEAPKITSKSGASKIIPLQPEASKTISLGKKLFRANCAACHNKNMIDDMVGPALSGTMERWKDREALLYDWIRNSSAVIASGDAYLVNLYKEYNKSVMTAFPNLEDAEIAAMLEYIESVN